MGLYTKYPDKIDSSTELPISTDLVTPVKAVVTNSLREAILAIEAELGINPSGTYSTVKDRLDSLIGLSESVSADVLAQIQALQAEVDAIVISESGQVIDVAGTAPIVSSGGIHPVISIASASHVSSGSLSSADKTKLDTLTSGAAVASVGATPPLASSGGMTPVISIAPSSDVTAGSMSAADFTKLAGINLVTNAAIGLAPIQSISVFSSGTPTLVADYLGRVNRLSGSVSGAILPPAVVGQVCIVELVNLAATTITTSGIDVVNGASNFIISIATDPIRSVVTFRCDAVGEWTVGSAGGTSSVVTNAANGLAPAQSITNHTTGTPTLVADPLGHENTVSGSVAGLILPVGTFGDKCRVRLLNFTSDIVITRSSSDLIKGNTTYGIKGSADPYAWVDLECVAATNWTAVGGGPSLPAYVADSNTAISISHNGASSGSGRVDQWLAEDAASGAFDGGGFYFECGDLGNSSHHPGDFKIHLGTDSSDTVSGKFILTSGSSPTQRLALHGYNGPGLHGIFNGGSFDWGTASGQFDITGVRSNLTFSSSIAILSAIEYHQSATAVIAYDQINAATITTSDNTITTLYTWGLTNGTVVRVKAVFVAANNTDHEGAAFERTATFKITTGGTVTQIGSTNNGGTTDDLDATFIAGSAAATIDFSGTSIRARVTGMTAKTVAWNATIWIYERVLA